jgi:hypothetical protein
MGVFGLFFLGDGLKNFSYEKQGRRPLSETKTFFKGSDQEVDVYHLQGREGGPTVLVFSGIHGDESGGYLTADRYADLKVLKGNLIVVPRLNLFAILAKRRIGLSGQDMNRKFQPREESEDPDNKVVGLAKSLMDQADIILNLHQGYGFYSPVWIDGTRNPIRWGQCNVIDAPTFDLPDGRRLELEHFARKVTGKINSQIADKKYHFQVNNTNTSRRVVAQGTEKIVDVLCPCCKTQDGIWHRGYQELRPSSITELFDNRRQCHHGKCGYHGGSLPLHFTSGHCE